VGGTQTVGLKASPLAVMCPPGCCEVSSPVPRCDSFLPVAFRLLDRHWALIAFASNHVGRGLYGGPGRWLPLGRAVYGFDIVWVIPPGERCAMTHVKGESPMGVDGTAGRIWSLVAHDDGSLVNR